MSSQNIIVPKRKREDESDEELTGLPQAKQRKISELLAKVKRSEATSPSSIPIPGSCRERYMKVNFKFSPLPKYKKTAWWSFVQEIKYIVFLKAVDQMRTQAKLPPLSRFEMEAAWYQQIDTQCNKRGLVNKPGVTHTEKLGLQQHMFTTAMNQRRDHVANRWWEEQKEKYPDLDVQVIYDDGEADKMQDNVEKWMAMEKDGGRDPASQYPFSMMKPAEVNFIRITCEKAGKEAADPDLMARPKPV